MGSLYKNENKENSNNFEIVELVLRKIKLMDNNVFSFSKLSTSFSVVQINALNWLYVEGCIVNDYQYDECYKIKLTKRGMLYLFLIDNKKEIEKFIMFLKNNGYNDLLIDSFLMSQDLNKSSEEILTLDLFKIYYDEVNKNLPIVLTERDYGYRKVRIPVK